MQSPLWVRADWVVAPMELTSRRRKPRRERQTGSAAHVAEPISQILAARQRRQSIPVEPVGPHARVTRATTASVGAYLRGEDPLQRSQGQGQIEAKTLTQRSLQTGR